MVEFLKQNPEAVVAFVALIQPYVFWLYKKYWKPGSIDAHTAGMVEIGYSNFGATIGVQGALRAIDRDLFVSDIRLTLTRQSDSSRHTLSWAAFRPPAALVNPSKDPIEVPIGFMLQTVAPRRFNILFFDSEQQADIQSHIEPLERAFHEDIRAKAVPYAEADDHWDNQFSKDPLVLKTYTAIDRANYWQAGRYRVDAVVQTTRPNRTFPFTFAFDLTAADVERLHRNSLSIMRAAVGVDHNFNFANATYLP